MTVSEKVAYLKGMMEGMKFDAESDEAKLIRFMAEILEDMASEIQDTQDEVADINEYLEAMDEDLTNVEDVLFDEDDECDCCDCDEEDCDCCCGEDAYEVTCPECKNIVVFEEAPEGESVICPSCGKEISLQ